MTHFTLITLWQTCLAAFVFFGIMAPPGFLLAFALDLSGFRRRPFSEQVLWSLALAAPFDLCLANVAGRFVPRPLISASFIILDALALVLLYRLWHRHRPKRQPLSRGAASLLLCMAAGACYLVFASLPLEWHGRLYEPVFSSDWQIRLPLIHAAASDGVPPHNPFFTLHGLSPVSRYYFYWFTLCADTMRLAHTDARATLVASSLFSALGIFAVLFLYLRHLPAESGWSRRALLLLGLCCVIGLDVLPGLAFLRYSQIRVHPELEWWLPDRSPGLLGALLYAPHHIAGAACGFLIVLLLSLVELESEPLRPGTLMRYGLALGLIFTAMVGTSTYISMFFSLAATVIGLVALFRRKRAPAIVLVTAAVLSLALSLPYLHELTAKTMTVPSAEVHTRLLGLALRQEHYSRLLMDGLKKHFLHRWPPRSLRFFIRIVMVFGLFLSEFGFYAAILLLQFRRDLRGPGRLSVVQRNLWLLAASVGFFFLFITSAPVQFVNDLGVHAGLVLRMLLMLWGAQWLAWYLPRRKTEPWTGRQRLVIRAAGVLLVLGALSAAWQAAMERGYLILLDAEDVPASEPFFGAPHLATLYADIHTAETAVAHQLSLGAVVQGNPVGNDQGIVRLYQQRRQAAGDLSCEGAFGGDPAVCRGILLTLLPVFGAQAPPLNDFPRVSIHAESMSLGSFAKACSALGLGAAVATDDDPVWQQSASWVWQGPVLFANERVRIIRCPGQ